MPSSDNVGASLSPRGCIALPRRSWPFAFSISVSSFPAFRSAVHFVDSAPSMCFVLKCPRNYKTSDSCTSIREYTPYSKGASAINCWHDWCIPLSFNILHQILALLISLGSISGISSLIRGDRGGSATVGSGSTHPIPFCGVPAPSLSGCWAAIRFGLVVRQIYRLAKRNDRRSTGSLTDTSFENPRPPG